MNEAERGIDRRRIEKLFFSSIVCMRIFAVTRECNIIGLPCRCNREQFRNWSSFSMNQKQSKI